MRNNYDILPEEQDERYQSLVHDLRQFYTPAAEDAQSLAHIRKLLLLCGGVASETREATPEPVLVSSPPAVSERGHRWERQRAPCETNRCRTLSVLAAVLLMTLLVGSLVFVLGRTQQGSEGAASSTRFLLYPNVGATDAGSLDPAANPNANTLLVDQMVYGGLLSYNSDMQVIPGLAQSWMVSFDQKTWTFHLRPDLKFSDGTPLTSADFAYAMTRALSPPVQSTFAAQLEGNIVGASAVLSGKSTVLTGVYVPDPLTLVINLIHPDHSFIKSLTNPLFAPLNENLINRYGQNTWGERAVGPGFGAGPFMVTAWNHQGQMTLVPNPYYYGPKLRLDEVNMTFVKDADAAYHSFLAHQYDFIWNIPARDQADAQQQAGYVRATSQHMAAIIPPWLHGVTLNSADLFFDWPNVYISPH